jgi:O-acetyl-ADP-ribose deacetylase (regulator of RNase III)
MKETTFIMITYLIVLCCFLLLGGKSIKDDCEDYITKNGELAINDVFVSKGGALNAKYISHVLSQEWTGGNETLIKSLEDSVFNCLTEAYKRRLSSIAIPAIGFGVNGYDAAS